MNPVLKKPLRYTRICGVAALLGCFHLTIFSGCSRAPSIPEPPRGSTVIDSDRVALAEFKFNDQSMAAIDGFKAGSTVELSGGFELLRGAKSTRSDGLQGISAIDDSAGRTIIKMDLEPGEFCDPTRDMMVSLWCSDGTSTGRRCAAKARTCMKTKADGRHHVFKGVLTVPESQGEYLLQVNYSDDIVDAFSERGRESRATYHPVFTKIIRVRTHD